VVTLTDDTLTADDFFTGFFASLAVKRYETVSRADQTFDRALAEAFNNFRETAEKEHIQVAFRIRLHPIHCDSIAVRDGIAMAVRRDLISLDNPVYQTIRVKLSKDEGDKILQELPGGENLFGQLVDTFLQYYRRAG
jgi:hypothetical protein